MLSVDPKPVFTLKDRLLEIEMTEVNLLTIEDNLAFKSILEGKSKCFIACQAKLYVTESENLLKKNGVLTIGKDSSDLWMRMYSLEDKTVVWEQDVPNKIGDYVVLEPDFHMFKSEMSVCHFKFQNDEDGHLFEDCVREILKEKNVAIEKHRRANKLKKSDIGLPSNFRHLAHMSMDFTRNFGMDEAKPFDGEEKSSNQSRPELPESSTYSIKPPIQSNGTIDRRSRRPTAPPPPPTTPPAFRNSNVYRQPEMKELDASPEVELRNTQKHPRGFMDVVSAASLKQSIILRTMEPPPPPPPPPGRSSSLSKQENEIPPEDENKSPVGTLTKPPRKFPPHRMPNAFDDELKRNLEKRQPQENPEDAPKSDECEDELDRALTQAATEVEDHEKEELEVKPIPRKRDEDDRVGPDVKPRPRAKNQEGIKREEQEPDLRPKPRARNIATTEVENDVRVIAPQPRARNLASEDPKARVEDVRSEPPSPRRSVDGHDLTEDDVKPMPRKRAPAKTTEVEEFENEDPCPV